MPDTQTELRRARLERTEFRRIAPAVDAALLAMGKAVAESGLEPALLELVKLRASQMNGCAFCVQYHTNLARQAGVEREKLDLLPAWHDAGLYSARERAALGWTEALTAMRAENEAAYACAVDAFGADEVVFLTAAIANINAWNRVAGGLRFSPPRAV
jgi:AhpD family alkylhydroperoxidase